MYYVYKSTFKKKTKKNKIIERKGNKIRFFVLFFLGISQVQPHTEKEKKMERPIIDQWGTHFNSTIQEKKKNRRNIICRVKSKYVVEG